MFYVYYGYVSPDNYDASEGPTYKIEEFKTAEAVEHFKREFEEDYLNDDCDNVIFRVFDGVERELKPKVIVDSYEFV